ncbi:neurite extension and migration factor [Erpetoichthys calabaricus]|uniref:Neurite extension and migration factor n=1 Tax=Erpetoichthys calabaricus TaxID=27687 RepID=A0A8C4SBM7_ERPCA|nr:neurite extension and migration factor [Erpetoichthys calabaricus]
MDVLQDNSSAQEQSPALINGVNENESLEVGNDVRPLAPTEVAVIVSSPSEESNCSQKANHLYHRNLPLLTSKEPCMLSPPSPLRLTDVPEQNSNDSSTQTISLTSCATKVVSPWSLPEDCERTSFTIMEPGGISTLSNDCLMQQSRTCLGCFIESKDGVDPEPGISLKVGEINRDYDTCSISDIQCMSTGEGARYGEQLLSDQLLSFPLHKSRTMDKKDLEKSDSDSEDSTPKNYYEGLLLDKCGGDEGLLSNTNQDWGYFESFISESKIELLDLCSRNELSVNLFSEEDVDNYMFDDDDSTLSSDVCSLKIRYESFQDNIREKSSALQEETQFNFFPNVLVNCTKKENNSVKKNIETIQFKTDEISLWTNEEKADSPAEPASYMTPKRSFFFDSNNSAEDSGEYSDDSSCTGSSYDTFREVKDCGQLLSRENSSSSSQLNYGLRAKRKVRYSDDYLYDVDSIDSEKNVEKREAQPFGPKEEDDDDWCPKKRRKSSRKEPPVIIKYIIINRFKGEKHMLVKLSKIDPTHITVNLNAELLSQYEKMAPLKDFWEKQQRDRNELLSRAHMNLNSSNRLSGSIPPKRKHKIASRLRIQRIQAVEHSLSKQGSFSFEHKRSIIGKSDATLTGMSLTIATANHASRLEATDIRHIGSVKSITQERDEKGTENKIIRLKKFKSEARLKSKKLKILQDTENVKNLAEPSSGTENGDNENCVKNVGSEIATQSPQMDENLPQDNSTIGEKIVFMPATCSDSEPAPPTEIAGNVPVVPGGYLQTLLDASDSSSSSGISYFPQHSSGQPPDGISQSEKQFTSLQLAQSCVLSPPSESELQQSPHHLEMEQNFSHIWQPGSSQAFGPHVADNSLQSNNFNGPLSVQMPDSLSVSEYTQLSLNSSRLPYHKSYLHDQPLPSDNDYQSCQLPCGEPHFQFQPASLSSDDGRVVTFDSGGSMAGSSSNYNTLTLKPCDKDGEDDINDNFLAHCSPKLVIQQSVDEIVPLKESADLLDISNFTPDKFRHSSLSEMSPPDTPNLSPQAGGLENKSTGKSKDFQETSEGILNSSQEIKWNCSVPQQNQHTDTFLVNNHQFQFHMFNDDDPVGLVEKPPCQEAFDKQLCQNSSSPRLSKSKKKSSPKQNIGMDQKTTKRAKVPKASKSAEKNKNPRQGSRSTKKQKNSTDAKNSKAQGTNEKPQGKFRNHIAPPTQMLKDGITVHNPASSVSGLPGEWPLSKEANACWSETNAAHNKNLLDDDQREFEEPCNILSNIASGMAEVQRFMMASIEPLWGPASGVCHPPEANSLKLKTLKILASTPPDSKKKGSNTGVTPGLSKTRKPSSKGSKNQGKTSISNPSIPNTPGECGPNAARSLFDKSGHNLTCSASNGPAHKKMYRHKTSAKFPRDENGKGKRADRDQNKDLAVMTSFEKLR